MSADLQFKKLIDRILRCREAEDEAKEDTKEVYAELKALGHDKTAAGALVNELRKRGKDGEKFEQASAMLDLYRDAYERASGTSLATHTHAPDRATSYAEAKGVDPKLVETIAKGVQTEIGCKALVTALDIMIEREEAETNSPETARTNPSGKVSGSINPSIDSVSPTGSQPLNGGVDANAGGRHEELAVEPKDRQHTDGPEMGKTSLAAREGEQVAATNSHSLPTSSQVADTADSVTPPALSATITAGPQSTAVPGGEPSTPSIDEGGAKMDEVGASPDRSDDKSGIHHAQSKQAAPNSDDVPAFLKSKEGCLRPSDCSIKFQTDALCYRCANDRAKGMVTA